MKITAEYLANMGACSPQVEHFQDLFGDSVELTVELAAKHATEFEWTWAADSLLSEAASEEFEHREHVIRLDYVRVLRDAQGPLDEILAKAKTAFEHAAQGYHQNDVGGEAYLAARHEYLKATQAGQMAYNAAETKAYNERAKAFAIAWAEVALKHGLVSAAGYTLTDAS